MSRNKTEDNLFDFLAFIIILAYLGGMAFIFYLVWLLVSWVTTK